MTRATHALGLAVITRTPRKRSIKEGRKSWCTASALGRRHGRRARRDRWRLVGDGRHVLGRSPSIVNESQASARIYSWKRSLRVGPGRRGGSRSMGGYER